MLQLLVAASPKPREILKRVLAGHRLACADTMTDAESLLQHQAFDLIVSTVVFDDSRMLAFLRRVKGNAAWEAVPFVCARVRTEVLRSRLAVEAVKFTTHALGAIAFLDVADYRVNPEREMRNEFDRILARRRS